MAKGGKNLLLKVEDTAGSGTYTTIAGLRSKSMTINNESIDVTNHGSNEWREILDTSGIKSIDMSGSGVFTSGATLTRLRQVVLTGALTAFQLVDADSGVTFAGNFKVESMEKAGEYNAEMTWSVTLKSSGEITVS